MAGAVCADQAQGEVMKQRLSPNVAMTQGHTEPKQVSHAKPAEQTKESLRELVIARLRQMPAERRATASAQACSLLEKQAVWKQARTVLLYAPMPSELDIWRLAETALADGKEVALPRFDLKTKRYGAAQIKHPFQDIKAGRFDIREPAEHCAAVDLGKLDLVLVPGLAFDLSGRRLGRGKGFYDRLLAEVHCKTCGVAFEEQVVAEVPIEPHDVRVNLVLTSKRWVETDTCG